MTKEALSTAWWLAGGDVDTLQYFSMDLMDIFVEYSRLNRHPTLQYRFFCNWLHELHSEPVRIRGCVSLQIQSRTDDARRVRWLMFGDTACSL